MKISEFQEISKRTMPKMRQGKNKMRYTKWDKCNYGMGISGEAGEVTDLIKKHIHHKHPLDIDELKKELGDVLHYVYGIATMFGISMDEVHTLNILKLNERYPNGYSDTDSLKRVDTIYDKNTIVNTPENFDIMSMYPQIMKEPVKAGKLQLSSKYGKFGNGDRTMKFNDIKPMEFEKIPFPKEEVELIVNLLIQLHNGSDRGGMYYNEEIKKSMEILNNGLKLMMNPLLIIKENRND